MALSMNPYAVGAPWLSEDAAKLKPYTDWHDGWKKKFFGEAIDSPTPDP